MLIAHGGKDTIAPYQQAKAMRKALMRAGNNPEYFIESEEGHGFFGQRSRIRYYNKLLAFLQENIGTETETVSWAEVKGVLIPSGEE